MDKTATIIREATSLPPEDRAFIVESLLQTLTVSNTEIEKKWGTCAKKRLKELRSGKIQSVSGEEVFEKIRQKHLV